MAGIVNGNSTALNKGKGTFLFTSESVGEGHPDKIAYVSYHQALFKGPAHTNLNVVTKSPMLSSMLVSRATHCQRLPARLLPRLV